jgi:ADP-heptose:LPS heptosyltransferase
VDTGAGGEILVFRTGQLGDALVALPAIRAVRLKHPRQRVVMLTDRHPGRGDYVAGRDVIEPTGWVDEFVTYVPDGASAARTGNLFRMLRRFRGRVEEVYDFSQLRSPAQALRDRLFFRHVIGARRVHTGGAYSSPARATDGSLPAVRPEWRRFLDLVGAENGAASFRLPIPAAGQEQAAQALAAAGFADGRQAVGFGIGSKRQTTRWPLERYAQAGSALLARHPSLEVLVVGGEEDRAEAAALCAGWGARSHNLAGRLSIYGSAAALRRCALFVGNDSGPLHLAALAGVRCVGILGARNLPGRWDPFGEGHVTLRRRVPCEGCRLEECRDRGAACIRGIGVDEVVAAAEGLLQRAGVPRT